MPQRIFTNCRSLFENEAMKYFRTSKEYSDFDLHLDKVLLISDRILASCEGNPDHGRVSQEISQRFQNLMDTKKDRGESVSNLLESLEIWLKAVFWLVNPSKWKVANEKSKIAKSEGKTSHFNLYQVILELGLLSEKEIKKTAKDVEDISDNVRRMIWHAKEDRNPIIHSGAEIPEDDLIRQKRYALIAFLAPIFRHQQALQSTLRCLVTRAPAFGPLDTLAKQVDSERRGHIEYFAGRMEWLTTLREKLETLSKNEGVYILLTASEGTGKSALVSKLSQFLADDSPVLGTNTTETQKTAPWLPGVILHLGKASNLPAEFVPFLINQISCLIVSDLPPFNDIFLEANRLETADLDSGNLNLKKLLVNKDDEGSRFISNSHSVYSAKSGSNGFIYARRLIFEALERLVAETGKVFLLLDALEEISSDGSSLAFLPERLPPGVSCLLTSRPQTPAVDFVQSKLKNIEIIELKQLTREEVPLLTNVPDKTLEGKEFNNKVMEKTDGLPLLLSNIGNQVRNSSIKLSSIQINGIRNRHFELKAKEWIGHGAEQDENNVLKKEILGLLSIFEPVMPIHLEDVQSYLISRNLDFELPKIRQVLTPVSTQLQGLEIGRIKLTMRPFAEYIRETYFSRIDLFRIFKKITEWLINDPDINPALCSRLFVVWKSIQKSEPNTALLAPSHIDHLNRLPQILFEYQKQKILFRIAKLLFEQGKETDNLAIECMRLAAKLGSLEAMGSFSNIINEDIADDLRREAVDWVKKGAENGDPESMMIIGNRLIEGRGINKDVDSGVNWLTRAADSGHARALFSLGSRLVFGISVKKNVEDGMKMICRASDLNFLPSDYLLGTLFVTGYECKKDLKKGLLHLEKAASSGFIKAIRFLGDCLIRGFHIEKDVAKGISYLEKAISLDDDVSTVKLARFFIEGDMAFRNPDKGIAILEAGVNKNQLLSKRELGEKLVIDNKKSNKDRERGIKLLEEAIEAGDVLSMEILAYFLLKQANPDSEKAKGLLFQAIELGSDNAAINLARMIGLGHGFSKRPDEAMKILRKFAVGDRHEIILELGKSLITGEYCEKNIKEGEIIIASLCENKFTPAMVYFSDLLLDGKIIKPDQFRGLALLEELVLLGDTTGMVSLGSHLINFNNNPLDIQRGLGLLDRAHSDGSLEATYLLGKYLIEGAIVEKNAQNGLKLIRQAASSSHIDSMHFLAIEMATGINIEKNDAEIEFMLNNIKNIKFESLLTLGMEMYLKKIYRWAAWCFFEAFKKGSIIGGNNLAFMARRKEVPECMRVPPLSELLKKGVQEKFNFSLVNKALCIINGLGATVDWKKADHIIASVGTLAEEPDSHPILFWHELTKKPEDATEGHLVVGWLCYHNKGPDPDAMTISERLKLAMEGGIDLPDFLISGPS